MDLLRSLLVVVQPKRGTSLVSVAISCAVCILFNVSKSAPPSCQCLCRVRLVALGELAGRWTVEHAVALVTPFLNVILQRA